MFKNGSIKNKPWMVPRKNVTRKKQEFQLVIGQLNPISLVEVDSIL